MTNRINFSTLSWVNESNELIDLNNGLLSEKEFTITQPTKIYKFNNEIIIENSDNPLYIENSEDLIKVGEIIIKDSKYYFKPNIIQSNNLYHNTELNKLSWLVYKSMKFPFNKMKYCLREGDVIKLGRETLLIRGIHVRNNRIKYLNLNRTETENKNDKGIFSYHTETSQSLNLDEDFNEVKNKENIKKKDIFNDKSEKTEKNNSIQLENKQEKEKIDLVSIDKENESKSNNKDLISNDINTEKKKKICRICYLEEENIESNPLIRPCKCSGSMKYIHYECLLHWLKTSLIMNKRAFVDNGYFDIYKLDLIECELCKNHLLNYIKHNNKIYSLIDYLRLDKNKEKEKMLPKKGKRKKEEKNYMIFDDIIPGKTGFLCRYLVKFDKENILRIGRGLDNQLILNDISVSRNHCTIKLDENYNLILDDNNSKFGSLVLVQAEEIEILKGRTLTVQIGTNYLSFKLEIAKNFFSCCNADEIDEKSDYEKINSKWVKYDKSDEILYEPNSGQESENENNVNHNEKKDQKEEKVEKEKENLIEDEENKKKEEENIIKLDLNKNNENMNTNNNNIESAMNISTLKINNQINISQIENNMEEIHEENKSEVEIESINIDQNNNDKKVANKDDNNKENEEKE